MTGSLRGIASGSWEVFLTLRQILESGGERDIWVGSDYVLAEQGSSLRTPCLCHGTFTSLLGPNILASLANPEAVLESSRGQVEGRARWTQEQSSGSQSRSSEGQPHPRNAVSVVSSTHPSREPPKSPDIHKILPQPKET